MSKFKAGDIVVAVKTTSLIKGGKTYKVAGVLNSTGYQAVIIDGSYENGTVPLAGLGSHNFSLAHPAWIGAARNTDPDTSKAAAKKVRPEPLRVRIERELLKCSRTGSELASALDAKLNSVTPRFAELKRLGRIKDSGQRVNGEIVWEKV